MYIPFHHVHAYSTARYVRHHVSGGKCRQEDQIVDLLVAKGRTRSHKAAVSCLGQYFLAVNTPTVVGHFDDNPATALRRRQIDRALTRFARRYPGIRTFDPVVERIPDHVSERIVQLLNDGFVDLRHFPGGDDTHLFAQRGGKIAHDSGHSREYRFDRLGADSHDAFL